MEVKEGEHYTLSKWGTFNNYECVKCQYSSIYLEKMQDHYDKADGEKGHHHIWAYPGAPSPTPVKDDSKPVY